MQLVHAEPAVLVVQASQAVGKIPNLQHLLLRGDGALGAASTR